MKVKYVPTTEGRSGNREWFGNHAVLSYVPVKQVAVRVTDLGFIVWKNEYAHFAGRE
jgi:hypothetical protein